ncbi:hypothetical protein Rsub_10903 [Raphidocelis subcapitata]|uniref:Uncharacterized protein n=1 Tax=Raphidocelis subcapitata TaxID=307507 RepID=A0A2V0PE03_9CHLO|nr:hypothetical protein Rsub_10903 [Raphidocelis subcapitata]|eukprot:GBF97739.1 hypothetical protein Rsub_10903 [Raphidocelis subcapitata]
MGRAIKSRAAAAGEGAGAGRPGEARHKVNRPVWSASGGKSPQLQTDKDGAAAARGAPRDGRAAAAARRGERARGAANRCACKGAANRCACEGAANRCACEGAADRCARGKAVRSAGWGLAGFKARRAAAGGRAPLLRRRRWLGHKGARRGRPRQKRPQGSVAMESGHTLGVVKRIGLGGWGVNDAVLRSGEKQQRAINRRGRAGGGKGQQNDATMGHPWAKWEGAGSNATHEGGARETGPCGARARACERVRARRGDRCSLENGNGSVLPAAARGAAGLGWGGGRHTTPAGGRPRAGTLWCRPAHAAGGF